MGWGGGLQNIASIDNSTVGGGKANIASGVSSTVGGGYNNHSIGEGATVAGGSFNAASGDFATVGGGFENTASVFAATVPGGKGNVANGHYSLAAGRRAKALNLGSFVWADSSNFDYSTSSDNGFWVRATGGVRFTTAINPATGAETGACILLPGVAPTWTCPSDRNVKENIVTVEGKDVLARLEGVPIARWNGVGSDPAKPHMGPMAQDFYAAFGLGGNDVSISTIDLDGVSLAAIKGLHEISKEQDQRIAALEAKEPQVAAAGNQAESSAIAPTAARLDALVAEVAALRQQSKDGTPWLPLAAAAIGLLGAGFGLGHLRRTGTVA